MSHDQQQAAQRRQKRLAVDELFRDIGTKITLESIR
jgi:hypothetical protein